MPIINLQDLKNYRDEILKAEIGALLFNLGKTHIGFGGWRNNFQHLQNKFKWSSYKEYIDNGNFDNEVSSISQNLKNLFDNLNINIPNVLLNLPLTELMLGGESSKYFVKQIFFRGCENVNSGIDKGSPKVQLQTPLWLSNAFGSFKHLVDEKDLDDARLTFFKNLDCFLQSKNYYQFPNWQEIRKFIFDEINLWYSKLLSDSRYPVNDVSLWDQAYMTASMFKAVLANMILDNSNVQTYQNNPTSIKWRILGIQYDKFGLAEKGFKPAHIKWYREVSKEIDEEIKKLLEYEYPVGNEVYRDESGIYFIVGEDLGENKDGSEVLKNDLSEIKEKILEIFKEKSKDEFYPAIFLTKASRGLMNLTFLLEKERENFLKADWSKKDLTINNNSKAIGICQICRQRLVFEDDARDENQNICLDCYEQKTKGRIDEWLNNRSGETIWTSELKDKNDRIALVVMKFELMDWLNGDLLNTTVLQTGINWANDVNNFTNELKKIFKNNCDKRVGNTVLKNYTDPVLHSLNIKQHNIIESLLLERSIGDRWEEFIKQKLGSKIDFDSRKIEWNQLNDKDINFLSSLILQFLLRKNPSPARLRRIWESTQEFFEEIEKILLCAAKIPDERRNRLYWEKVSISDGEYYDGDALFWAKDGNVYLISYLKDKGKQSFKLRRYEDKTYTGVELQISNAKIETYKPYLSIIDPTPISWQFIIPAEYVPDLIKNVQKLYDEHFKYVYGKLPLHIGVVIQDYKKPLYVGINALRKMRRDVVGREKLWVEIEAKAFKAIFDEKLKKEKIEEQCNNPREYYPLYFGELNKGDYQFYIRPKDNLYWLKSVKNIKDDEKVKYIPNTFDFEFLDTNARRNDIYYDENQNYRRALELKSNRPYNIEKHFGLFLNFKEAFSTSTSKSKLNNLISLFYDKFENFENNSTLFLASGIINILEPHKNPVVNEFIKKWLEIDNTTHEKIKDKISREKIAMFIDMYEFWHKALQEV